MASFSVSAAFSASLKNFTMGDFHSPFSTLMKARPLAPKLLAYSVMVSIWPCVAPARPLALIALTTPPLAIAPLNTLNVLRLEFLGEIHQFHAKPRVRLVNAVAVQRLLETRCA